MNNNNINRKEKKIRNKKSNQKGVYRIPTPYYILIHSFLGGWFIMAGCSWFSRSHHSHSPDPDAYLCSRPSLGDAAMSNYAMVEVLLA